MRPPTCPSPSRRGTRRLVRRALGTLAVLVAIALVTTSLAAYLKFRDVWDSITRIDVVGLGNRPPQLASATNVLLIGSDSRAGPNAHFGAGITGQRSDTIIVLHIAPDEHNVVALSIPRDSVVPIMYCPPEAGTSGQAAEPGQVEQINATFADGGPGCLWKTIEQTTHLRLDHFIELNFTGFEKVIDDLGGVSICLPFPVHDPQSRLNLTAGRHHVWGAEALAFWRARYIGEGSDLQRIERDQYLMASLLQGIERSHLSSSPTRLLSVVTDAAHYMATDSGLTLPVMTTIVETLRGLRPGEVQFIELPTIPYGPNPDWVTWPASDARLFGAIARDQQVSTAGARLPGPRPRPRRPTSLGSVRAGLTLTAAVRGGSASPGSGGPGDLPGRYGGITGAANPCADSRAFTGPRGGS
jgi:LCP family protein required for cell wall assembly